MIIICLNINAKRYHAVFASAIATNNRDKYILNFFVTFKRWSNENRRIRS